MDDLVDRLGTVGLWGEAREEILRLRAEVAALMSLATDTQLDVDKLREKLAAAVLAHIDATAEVERLRAEVARLQGLLEAKDELLSTPSYAAANWRRSCKEVEEERDRLRAEVAALKFACDALKKGQPDPDAAVRDERDRLRELLREARPYLNGFGWGKPGVDLPDRIDAALGGEKKDEA